MRRHHPNTAVAGDHAIRRLKTEGRNPSSASLDTQSALQLARTINREDAKVAGAVRRALPQIARAIEWAAAALSRGGRLIYVGAGSSGRIAALDASECRPTFNTSAGQVQYLIAGGNRALSAPAEGKEDSRELGRRDMQGKKPGRNDVVIGLAASGRTPYTIAAVEYARARGARTVAVSCNPGSPLTRAAHLAIVAEVGPEVVAGSSRMKAGTAQKMVLNMISTGAMARLGRVLGNLMVNVSPTNSKLMERALTVLERAGGTCRSAAAQALQAAGGNVPAALIMLHSGATRQEAERELARTRGHVRQAIERAQKRNRKTRI
jgi:N-acetylmuramic acid 6-phosphate etherase